LTGAIWHLTRRAIDTRPDELLLHAAAVVLDGRTVIISGRSGAGKSTTAGALIQRGGKYLSDEVVVVDRVGQIVEWLPRPLGLDVSSVEMLGGSTEQRAGPVERRVPPAECWTGAPPTRSTIVFLDEVGGPLVVRQPTRSDAVARLIGEAFLPGARRQWGLERVEALTRSAVVVRLRGGTPPERVAAIRAA
jgi:hypothetical protein